MMAFKIPQISCLSLAKEYFEGIPSFQWTELEIRIRLVMDTLARWKTRGRGPGVRGPGVRGPGVWKTWGLVENAGSGGKRGVWWETRGPLEYVGSGGKHWV